LWQLQRRGQRTGTTSSSSGDGGGGSGDSRLLGTQATAAPARHGGADADEVLPGG
jgi:hypothetical protein